MESNWISIKDNVPPQDKIVLAWAEWWGCTGLIWREENKVKCEGRILAYIDDRGEWWDQKATLNSSPMEVLYWQELLDAPNNKIN